MRILGIHCDSPHDAGVAVCEDGRVTFALGEERLSRVKQDGAVPARALAEALRFTGLALDDFDAVHYTGTPPLRRLRDAGAYSRASYAMRRAGRWDGAPAFAVLKRPRNALGVKDFAIHRRKERELLALLANYSGPIERVSHHTAHATAAYYAGGIPGSAVLVVEGVGDLKTTSWFRPTSRGLVEEDVQLWPESVGRFYECVTKILGFNVVRHGGKITGLAAYGDPDAVYDKVRPLLRNDGPAMRVAPEVFGLIREYAKRGKRLPARFEGARREDIAAAFQRRLEEVVVAWTEGVLKRGGARALTLSGGVFANVKLNQRLDALPGVDALMVHPAMSDAGLAVGAALAGWERAEVAAGRAPEPLPLPNAFLGPEYVEAEMSEALRAAGLAFERPGDVHEVIADELAAGRVVARFTGRLEYGPRALGNRSILYRASDPAVNEWLNRRLDRTEFMPFAPAVAWDWRERLFRDTSGAARAAEFMTVTFDCTPEMRARGAAAVHVDGTARPQLVRPEANPALAATLAAYERRTGFPCVVNTSFNMHEEPIVCTPRDAVRAFLDADLDVLAMGPFVVRHLEPPNRQLIAPRL